VPCRITDDVKRVALTVRGKLSSLDLLIVSGAAVAFVAGFFPWWGENVDHFGSLSVSGWSAGFTAWAGTLLLTAAGLLLLFRRASGSWPPTSLSPSMLVVAVSAAGLLLVFVRWLSLRRHFGNGLDYGARYGIYLALIAGIVEVVAAIVELRTSGDRLPWSRPRNADALR
jgi:hypothetical protein